MYTSLLILEGLTIIVLVIFPFTLKDFPYISIYINSWLSMCMILGYIYCSLLYYFLTNSHTKKDYFRYLSQHYITHPSYEISQH